MAPGTNSHCLVTSHTFRYVHKGSGYFWNGCIVSQTWSARDVGPNITGENGTNIGDSGTPSGAFRRDSRVTGNGSGDGDQFRMGFDASRSNDIFGSSAVVQPAALLSLPCIKT